jgi:hypothetical protein
VLKDEDKVLLGTVDKLLADDKNLYIHDATISKGVFAFDKKGNFIRQYGVKGDGPGEYDDISDFTVDFDKRELYLLDDKKQDILIHNIDNGDYIRTVKLDDKSQSYSIQYYRGRLFADMHSLKSNPDENILKEIDINTGKDLNTWLNIVEYNKTDNPALLRRGWRSVFYNDYSGVPKFKQFVMTEFISLENEEPAPYLKLTGNNIIKIKEDMQKAGSINQMEYSVQKYPNVRAYSEFKDHIFIDYSDKKQTDKIIIYNKESGQYLGYPAIKDDLVYKKEKAPKVFSNFLYSDKKGIYDYPFNFAYGIAPFLESRDKGILSDKISNNIEITNLKEESNPVIFYYEYK